MVSASTNKSKRQRKLSEERYKELIEGISDQFFAFDNDLRVVNWNKATEKITHVLVKDAVDRSFFDLFPNLKGSVLGNSLLLALKKRKQQSIVFKWAFKDKTMFFEMNIYPTKEGISVFAKDITDKYKLQNSLRQSEKKYKFLYDESPSLNIIVGIDGTVKDINKSSLEMLGYRKKDVIGRSILDFIVKEQKKKVLQLLKKATVGRLTAGIDISVNAKDGTIHTIYFSPGQSFLYEDEKPVGLIFTGIDVTDRKHLEIELEKSEATYRIVADNTYDFEFWLSPQGKYLYVSPSCKKITGYSPKDFMKDSGLSKKIIFSEDDAIYKNHIYEEVKKHKSGEAEWRIIHKNGIVHWISHACQPIYDDDGKYLGVRGSNRDVTENKKVERALQESEERFRLAQRSAHIGNWDWDVISNTLVWSEEMERIFGFKPRSFRRTYEAFLACVHPDDRLFVDYSVRDSLEKSSPYDIIYRIIWPDKQIRWISATGDVIRNKKGIAIRMLGIVQDITDRKYAEDSLQETRNYLESLLNYANAPIIVWDSKSNITRFNRAFERLTGYTADEIVSQKLRILFPRATQKESLAKIRKTLSGEYWESVEIPILCKDGNIRIVLWNSANINNPSNKRLIATIAQGQDITDRKQVETELVRLASFPENNPNPIIEIDYSGRIHYINSRAKKIFPKIEKTGFSHPYLKGIKQLFPKLRKEEKYPKRIREIKVGTRFYLQTLYYVSEYDRIRIYSIDITERKQTEETLKESEEKYRRIVENTTNVILATKGDGIISYLSPTSKAVFGYAPSELIGTRLTIFHPDDVDKAQQAFSRALHGEKGSNFEYRILTKKGETKWISHSWSPIILDGKLQTVVSVIEDITQRKAAGEKIRKLNESLLRHSIELAAANKELEAFSYSVSHDLRAPLRSIDGFSQALLEDYATSLDDQGKDYIQRVRKATQKMGQLIDDMLRLSRLTRAELSIENIDLTALAREVIEKLQSNEPSREVKIEIQERMIERGDKKLLEILLDNLLGNAWKFTCNSSQPAITFGRTPKEDECVYFIRDNGAGFDMAYADKLFVPFQRLHSTDEFPGTGIGLAIASRIVHRHGGRIWAESGVDKGATFYFTLQKRE